jgi:hypothetical protein
LPPFLFVATAVEITVMHPAQPASKRARLPKSEVVGVRRATAADQAGLRTDKLTMRPIAFSRELQKGGGRLSIDWCNPLGDIGRRPILARQSTLRVGSALIALSFG